MSRLIAIFALGVFTAVAAVAQITVVTTASNTTTTYTGGSNTFFSSISVQAGDFLVVAHSNNKNNNGTNTITAAMTGISDTFSTIAPVASGGTAGAWIFYAPITANGTISAITLDTSSATKTVSQATQYYLIRPGSGQTLSFGASDAQGGSASSSKSLNFTFSSSNADYFAVSATAVGATAGVTVTDPAGWTQSVSGASKREIYYLDASTGGSSSLSVTSTVTGGTDVQAFTGIVVLATTPVPEPSTYALIAGAASLGFIMVRRHRRSRRASDVA